MRLSESVLRALGESGAIAQRTLAKRLGLEAGRGGEKRLERALRELEAEGSVERRGRMVRRVDADGGVFEAELVFDAKRDAWFATDESGRRVPIVETSGACDGDRVALVGDGDGASVVQVVSPSGGSMAGVFERGPRGGIVELLGASPVPLLRVARDQSQGAEIGELVLATAARRGGSREPWGRVVERLGSPGDPDADFRAQVVRHRLPVEFSERALEDADRARRDAESDGADGVRSGTSRRDRRAWPFVTIDPASARDHDDAVFVEPDPGSDSLRMHVAIADVSSFVEAGSALDREALERGNSVYFPDRSIPMLPEALSSDACSLVPDRDRRALVASFEVLPDGRVRGLKLEAAWIRSHAKLAYEEAVACVEGDASAAPSTAIGESLARLGRASHWLRDRRAHDGALELDLPETLLRLGSDGRPVDAAVAERNDAHRAIEDAMLAANRSVAQKLVRADVPAIFRVHEPPAPADGADLRARLARLGLLEGAGGGHDGPLSRDEFLAALDAASASPELQAWLQMAVLRSMKQARYSAHNRGHFALGFEAYCHFTSPIRRYADLVVHRAVHRLLAREAPLEAEPMETLALRLSIRERVAQRAERDMDALKACALMADRVGESFEGVVTGIASHGVYARLHKPRVEGFLPMRSLPGDFRVDGDGLAAVCGASGQRIALGDELGLRLAGTTPARGWLRFELEDDAQLGGRRSRGRAGKGGPKGRKKGSGRGRRSRR